MKTEYTPMDPVVVQTSAHILGEASATAKALAAAQDMIAAGGLPVFIQASSTHRSRTSGSVLVVDARMPPDFLPEQMRGDLQRLADEHDREQSPAATM